MVICVIDAARPDHVGCYGYPRETTPNMDRLAERSVLFEQYFCQYPLTRPSVASLLTGQHPDTHLARGDRALSSEAFTLFEGLRGAGYHTVLFSGNPNAAPPLGIGRHLDEVCDAAQLRRPRDSLATWRPEPLLERIAASLERDLPSPFAMYIHLMPPHFPYEAPEKMKRLFEGQDPPGAWEGDYPFPEVRPSFRAFDGADLKTWVNDYDANMRYADWAVGEVQRLLEEAGLFEDVLFIVTSDHGEAFGEHGYRMHGSGVYDELVWVPLLLKLPGREPRAGRIEALTQSVDVLPTILDLLAVGYPREEVQGRSLAPLIAGETEAVNEYVFARATGSWPSYLVRDREWALVLYRGGRLRALYDLRKDPQQRHNVVADEPEVAAELAEAFRRFAEGQAARPLEFVDPDARPEPPPDRPKVELSEEDRKELRALGYLD